jgi:hypothetical protein
MRSYLIVSANQRYIVNICARVKIFCFIFSFRFYLSIRFFSIPFYPRIPYLVFPLFLYISAVRLSSYPRSLPRQQITNRQTIIIVTRIPPITTITIPNDVRLLSTGILGCLPFLLTDVPLLTEELLLKLITSVKVGVAVKAVTILAPVDEVGLNDEVVSICCVEVLVGG